MVISAERIRHFEITEIADVLGTHIGIGGVSAFFFNQL
jgi:fatty acid-binding protein DegV